jgi:hypothetical protein
MNFFEELRASSLCHCFFVKPSCILLMVWQHTSWPSFTKHMRSLASCSCNKGITLHKLWGSIACFTRPCEILLFIGVCKIKSVFVWGLLGRWGKGLSVEAKMFVANTPQQLFRFSHKLLLVQVDSISSSQYSCPDIHRHCHSKAWAFCKSLSCKRKAWRKKLTRAFILSLPKRGWSSYRRSPQTVWRKCRSYRTLFGCHVCTIWYWKTLSSAKCFLPFDVAIGLTSTQQLNQSSKCSFDPQLHSIPWSFEALEADPCQLLRTTSKANLRAEQRLRQIHRLVLRAHYQLMLPLHDKQEVYINWLPGELGSCP